MKRILIVTLIVVAAVVAFHLFASDTVGWLKALHGHGGSGQH